MGKWCLPLNSIIYPKTEGSWFLVGWNLGGSYRVCYMEGERPGNRWVVRKFCASIPLLQPSFKFQRTLVCRPQALSQLHLDPPAQLSGMSLKLFPWSWGYTKAPFSVLPLFSVYCFPALNFKCICCTINITPNKHCETNK